MLTALVLCFGVTRYQRCVHGLLVVVIVRQPSMNLGRRQVWIVCHDLRCTVAMRDMIRGDVDHPVPSAVYAGSSLSIEGDVGVSRVFMPLLFPAR